MAVSYKVIIKEEKMKRETEKELTEQDAIIAIVADLQEEQDKECETVLEQIQEKVSSKILQQRAIQREEMKRQKPL